MDSTTGTRGGDAVDAPAPQVWDAMTVEVALSVMASARSGHLLVCDEDGQCTRLITQAQLIDVRSSSAYTDRVRLRDIVGDSGPFTSPRTLALIPPVGPLSLSL